MAAQDYYWTGNGQNQDFFNEENWINPSTNQPPDNGSIDPSQPINFDLLLSCEASTISSKETDIISQTPVLFSEVSNNDDWSHFYRATSLNDGNNGAQQTFVINVTSLPVGGANFRDIRNVANGQWAIGNSQALTLGVNTITVNEVSFDRAVKIQFSSGYVAFDALFLNGSSLYSAPSEPIVFEPSKTLYISNGVLNVSSFSGGNLILNENSYVHLNDSDPLLNNAKVYFNSSLSWLRLDNVNPNQVHDTYMSQMFVSDTNAEYPATIRLDNYYDNGTVVRPQSLDTTPLTIYSNEDNTGTEAEIVVNQVYSGSSIPNQLNNNIHSFYLKRGYMLTIAVNDDGTGKSKVFIASEEDLEIHSLSNFFQAGISFIRVIPWNWVSKKGTGGDIAGMDNTWFYRWNNQGLSDLQRECSPMAWGYGGANDSNDINLYQSKYKTTHVLGFNEPDDCNGQSGQYNDLCTVSTAVGVYENLMKTGLRMVSPACRQGAVFTWLDLFNQQAIQNDIRIDVIAVHWYDWGANPQDSPNADPNTIFNRFKVYLQNVYALYGLPIWITEFNGNKYRSIQSNRQFMELAIPYLEGLDFVERYAWFEPQNIDTPDDPGNGEFFDEAMNLTDIGMFYKNQTSAPSIAASYYSGHNNLNDETLVNQYAYLCTPSTESAPGIEGLNIYKANNENFVTIAGITPDLQELDVRLYSVLGGAVKQTMLNTKAATQRISTQGIASGLYIVMINFGNQTIVKKVIIK